MLLGKCVKLARSVLKFVVVVFFFYARIDIIEPMVPKLGGAQQQRQNTDQSWTLSFSPTAAALIEKDQQHIF